MHSATDIQVGSISVRLEAVDSRGGAAIREVSEAFGTALSPAAKSTAVVRVDTTDALPTAQPQNPPVTSYGPDVHIYRVEDGFRIQGPSAVSAVDLPSSLATVTGLAGAWSDAEVYGHIVVVLTLLLREQRFFPLHAAGVTRDGEGVLIVGPSDAGKSTLAYNLVRGGWAFLSDDTVLIHRGDKEAVSAHTFRRRFGLDAEIGTRRPEVETQARPMLGDSEKWSVSVSALFPGSQALACTPSLLVFSDIIDEPTSRLEPLSSGDAFMRLLSQSALREFSDSLTAKHHESLSSLLSQARRVRLRAGRDLLDSPHLAVEFVQTALRRGSGAA